MIKNKGGGIFVLHEQYTGFRRMNVYMFNKNLGMV